MPTSNFQLIFSQSDYLIQVVVTNSNIEWQTVQIQISWLLQKPTDLDLHCLQRHGIFGFSRTRVKTMSTILTCSMANSLVAAPEISLIGSAYWSKPNSIIFSKVNSSAVWSNCRCILFWILVQCLGLIALFFMSWINGIVLLNWSTLFLLVSTTSQFLSCSWNQENIVITHLIRTLLFYIALITMVIWWLTMIIWCLICYCLVLSVSSSSLCLGWAIACDCGTQWTFHLPFL